MDGLVNEQPEADSSLDSPAERQLEVWCGGDGNAPRPPLVGLNFADDDGESHRRHSKNLWQVLISRFQSLSRLEQEALLVRTSQISLVTVGILICCFFYPYLPLIARILGLPILLMASWACATYVLFPIVAAHVEDHLNEAFPD